MTDVRQELIDKLARSGDRLVEHCRGLIAASSGNPPGDTRAVAVAAARLLADIPGVVVETHTAQEPIVNLVARLSGGGPGRQLVFNGHLDTYPVGDRTAGPSIPWAAKSATAGYMGAAAAI